MTMGLWGFEESAEGEGHYVAMRGTCWEWWRVVLRVLVTPVTVAIDVTGSVLINLPTLLLDVDDGDDHGDAPRRSSRGCSDSPTQPPAMPGKPMVSGVRR